MTTVILKRVEFDEAFDVVRSSSPIIKSQTLSALEKSRLILQQAHEDASQIRARAEETLKQAEREREEERQRGYDEGREEGQEELIEKISEAELAHEKILNEAEPQIVKMVMDIAEKVVGQAVLEGAVVDVVKKAILESVGKKIIVRIHPQDVALLKERQSEILSGLGEVRSISFQEDESIPSGGCIVETELGVVDAKLETQLNAIRKALGLI